MGHLRVVVMGAGVSGMATALLLARDGHSVSIVERDHFAVGALDVAIDWKRKGVPHFVQPHAFIPRGRVELKRHLPDVYDDLVKAGARDVDVRSKIPGPSLATDADLSYFAVRRPVIEWGLRRAVLAEPRISVLSNARVTGIALNGARVTGVLIDGSTVDADLVVDALGRRTETSQWLESVGFISDPPDSSDCGVVYYSRYFRVREGCELPDGPWTLGPRGDLGYLAFATFPGDNRTFAALLAVPPGVAEWRSLKDPDVFNRVIASIPLLRTWVDHDTVEVCTDVLTMAGLRNLLRTYDPTLVVGLVPVGDAYCHTDPVLAHGLSFGLIHAATLASALRQHDDIGDACTSYAVETKSAIRERYEFATHLDEQPPPPPDPPPPASSRSTPSRLNVVSPPAAPELPPVPSEAFPEHPYDRARHNLDRHPPYVLARIMN
jgi:2-polyprenyl-6-methoxyphenol hydroxylase-like FAD-dependent oxidoreductase